MTKDHTTIKENLLQLMIDHEETAKSRKRQLSLSHHTRKFRLETLLQVLDLTRESVENFFDDFEVHEKTPSKVIDDFSEDVLEVNCLLFICLLVFVFQKKDKSLSFFLQKKALQFYFTSKGLVGYYLILSNLMIYLCLNKI